MKQYRIAATAMMLLFFVGFSFADTTAVQQTQVTQSGFIGLEAGEIVHGVKDVYYGTGPNSDPYINKVPLERLLFQYINDYSVTKHIRAVIAMECQLGYSYPYDLYQITTSVMSSAITVYPDRAEGMYTLDDLHIPLKMQFGFGYFPFRTDHDVKNLGEYLFRSGTYPTYVINNFNRPYARLLGARASATAWDCLHGDILLTSQTQIMPLMDYSLTFLGSFNLKKVIEIGAGVSFTNIISEDSSATTTPKNTAIANGPGYFYIDKNGDTNGYTFKAIKPMARFAFDPKPLLPRGLSGLMGKGDGRLYGEVCVTGWQNYKNYNNDPSVPDTKTLHIYENRLDRTVAMLGFNVPTFKALDVLSFEMEHMSNRYPNSILNVDVYKNPPYPVPSFNSDLGQPIWPWFWSLYAKKTFLGKFALIVQAAHDHMRPVQNDATLTPYEDVLERKGDWWWNVRLNVYF